MIPSDGQGGELAPAAASEKSASAIPHAKEAGTAPGVLLQAVEPAGKPKSSRTVFILAPYGHDARLTAAALDSADIHTQIFPDSNSLCQQPHESCGAMLLAEEVLHDRSVARLTEWLGSQPSWSELPVILVTSGGETSPSQRRQIALLEGSGSITFLERPFRQTTLISTVQAALRSRLRQHQVRDLMQQTQRDAAALRLASRRKDEFLAMLAHELRNPLSSLTNAALLLSEPESDQDTQSSSPAKNPAPDLTESTEPGRAAAARNPIPGAGARTHAWAVGVISRQTAQLSRLVDDLLDVSRVTQGKIVLRLRTLDLADILTSACEAVAPLIQTRHHTLHTHFQPGKIHLHADPARVEQILVNLLTNAAKYTPPHGTIYLSAQQEAHQAVISVQDSGIGISADRIHEMFDLFTQGDRNAARSEGGLGIGLTIVKNLCELHGGSVHATSPGIDQGCTFTVRLPALSPRSSLSTAPLAVEASPGNAQVTQPAKDSQDQSPAPGLNSGSSLTSHVRPAAAPQAESGSPQVPEANNAQAATSPARILVVDDNTDSAHGLARLLQRRGYVVDIAYDGETALNLAHQNPPAAILLDIGLPGIDGHETARRLRARPVTASTLCIALTGYGQAEDFHRSRASGFDAHFIKPVEFASLLACLHQHQVHGAV